ncbi:hypothetical protein GCM10023178_03140 [Actinomadura luteofluorescens]
MTVDASHEAAGRGDGDASCLHRGIHEGAERQVAAVRWEAFGRNLGSARSARPSRGPCLR